MLAKIIVVLWSDNCHICLCVYWKYDAHYHCLLSTWFSAIGRGIAPWGPHIEGRRGCFGIPQGDEHTNFTHHKQHIFSYRIERVIILKSLLLNIGPNIDLVCLTSSFFTDIVTELSWIGAIWWPCSIQLGSAKLLFVMLCACRPFWHPSFTKLQC